MVSVDDADHSAITSYFYCELGCRKFKSEAGGYGEEESPWEKYGGQIWRVSNGESHRSKAGRISLINSS